MPSAHPKAESHASTSELLRVMISSRVNDPVEFRGRPAKLAEVRQALKQEIEADGLFGDRLFEVWINELAPAAAGSRDSWETCMRQVLRANIVIALYNGNAGWSLEGSDVGICHAEMEAALASAPAKLRIIEIVPLAALRKSPDRRKDERFREYYASQSRFHATAANGEEIIAEARRALRASVIEMCQLGLREARKGKYYTGKALDWSRLDFQERAAAMRETLTRFLAEREGATKLGQGVAVPCAGERVLFLPHAIPAAFSVAPARELVGQPFLTDHLHVTGKREGKRESWLGPVHLVACQKTITENQGIRLLGFPDATVVSPPFGVYTADNVQKIQMILLANCRDDTTTRLAAQRFFEWLRQTGEDARLAARAAARRRIAEAIAAEAES